MDPMTAFSLAAGVIQVIDCSFKVVNICRELAKDGSLAPHRNTEELTDTLVKGMERLKATNARVTMSRSQDDNEIIELSAKCSVIAEDLLAELRTLRLEQSGFRHAIAKSFRVIKQKASLKEKQALLEKYQQVLDTRILQRLDSRSLKETQDFHTLDQEVRNLAIALEHGHRTFARLLSDQCQDLKEYIDKGFETQAQATAESLAHQRLLESLFFPEIVSRQEQISDAFEGTYQWIFDLPDSKRVRDARWSNFHDWLENSNSIYWISGKPGSGKSTLMKFIVHEDQTSRLLEIWKKDGRLIMISFFFWRAGSDLQKSATGLLRSLLYQIASQCPDSFNHIRIQDRNVSGDVSVPINLRHLVAWTDQSLLYALKCFLNLRPASLRICAFIDGLDEFIGEEELLLDVIRIFGDAPQCKVCVSSRPEQAFRREFELCSKLRVQDLNHKDLERTVAGKLSPQLEKYTSPNARRSELEWAIVVKAEGVFLWLDLMIKVLIRGARNGDSYDTLLFRLDQTPDTINGLYTHIWENLDSVYRTESLKYFHTLLVAKGFETTVTLADLVCADGEPRERMIQFDREYFVSKQFTSVCRHLETRLVACCGGLLEVLESLGYEEEPHDGFEDNEWKEGDSRDEEIADGDSDDKNVDKNVASQDLKTASAISFYNKPVDFVHRTAFDFVRDLLRCPQFYESASYLDANIRLSIGKISQLMIYSLTKPRVHQDQSRQLGDVFRELMSFTSATEYLIDQATNKAVKRFGTFEVDLTHQLLLSLQHIYTFFHQTEKFLFADSSFVQTLIVGSYRRDIFYTRWCPVSDWLSAAAYFGCYNYVQSRLPQQSINDVYLPKLLQSAISGSRFRLKHNRSGDLSCRNMISTLLTIRILLKHHFDPNEMLAPNHNSSPAIDGRTYWGETFAVIMSLCLFLSTAQIPESERRTGQACTFDIVERFLDLGAKSNTRIFFTFITYYNSITYAIIMEASPLAMVDLAEMKNIPFYTKTQASLRSAGACNYRYPRYLRMCSVGDLRYIRLSKVQSETINETLCPGEMYIDPRSEMLFIGDMDGPASHALRDILGSFSEEDSIDEETMLNEIASLPESF
ncbi:MAG: hypothetical protein Q9195_009134 [Heterodermia aff. obscurata]